MSLPFELELNQPVMLLGSDTGIIAGEITELMEDTVVVNINGYGKSQPVLKTQLVPVLPSMFYLMKLGVEEDSNNTYLKDIRGMIGIGGLIERHNLSPERLHSSQVLDITYKEIESQGGIEEGEDKNDFAVLHGQEILDLYFKVLH